MRIAGWSFGSSKLRLAALPAIAVAGCSVWLMLPQSHSAATPSVVTRLTQIGPATNETSGTPTSPDPSAAPASGNPAAIVDAPLDVAPPETGAPAKSPIDGLRISSQSWRRGGLGSKALVTFTLRNGNDYAVKDVEIACAFARRDGSHLTDRRRTIPDVVNMKSRKRYAGMLVGFVNVNASKAKCSLVTASRN